MRSTPASTDAAPPRRLHAASSSSILEPRFLAAVVLRWVGFNDLARLLKAAGNSGADLIAESLPKKYDSVLGRWFDSGHELSLGQWQKVALARAFMNGGEVLVLDEPTASLDAEAEYEIFQRFRDLTEKRIAILVSHRFSTVRMADRIAVLKAGRLEELGSHAELVARGGTYARLFDLQAQGYR